MINHYSGEISYYFDQLYLFIAAPLTIYTVADKLSSCNGGTCVRPEVVRSRSVRMNNPSGPYLIKWLYR